MEVIGSVEVVAVILVTLYKIVVILTVIVLEVAMIDISFYVAICIVCKILK